VANTVTCNQCGTALDEDSSIEPEKREHCPVCGSTARRFSLQVETGYYRLEGSAVAFNVVRNTASLLLQAVIVPGAKTDEGQLIEAVALPWFEIIELLCRDPSLAYQIEARK
jgi:hypothetical protein